MDDSTPGELKADLLQFWAWLKAHPRTVSGVIWFIIGFVLGSMAG